MKQASFDEFAANLTSIFNRLARKKEPVIVSRGKTLMQLRTGRSDRISAWTINTKA